MSAGKIESIHRYPVKSMLGETLHATTIGALGIPGDRAWAVRDEVRGGIRGAKKIPALMALSAAYVGDVPESGSGRVRFEFPGGASCTSDDPEIASLLSDALNHAVSLWPLMPADLLDHYRRGAPDHEDFEQELREIFGREPHEPLPDLGVFPPEVLEYESPPGTYFDAFPLLLMTRQSLASMADYRPQSAFDPRRFRPNLLIDAAGQDLAFPETAWVGRRARIGSAVLKMEAMCPRCSMTTHAFDDLPKDPGIMRSLVTDAEGNLGIYGSVEEPGQISVGDELVLLD